MTDRKIDLLVAGADPIDPARLDAPALDTAAAELHAAIVVQQADPDCPSRSRRWRPRGHLARRAVAVGLIGAAGLGVAAVIGIDRIGDGTQPAWAAPALRAAEASPRMLIGGSGWSVTRADEWGVDVGETVFENGREEVQLNWYPKSIREIETPDKERTGTTAVAPTTHDGDPVVIAYYGDERYRASWDRDEWTLELDGNAAGAERFTEILHALQPVGVDEWLSAMPASSVRPDGRAVVVDAMLAGIPMPPGLDLPSLREGAGLVKDRYQLGAEVSGAVACAWIGRWVDARAANDTAAADAAVATMATSHDWPILKEMNAAGDYPEVLWETADAMPTNADVAAGAPGLKLADSYRQRLGCTG